MNNNTSSLVISRSKQQGRPFTSISDGNVGVEVEARGHDHCHCPSSEAPWEWPGGLGTSRIYTQENTFQDVPWRQLSHVGVPPWAGGRTRNHPLFMVWTRHSESQGYGCADLYAITQVTHLMSRACKTVLFLRPCNCSKDNHV